jgi:hypothetical protein
VYTRSQQGGDAPFIPGQQPHIDWGARNQGVISEARQLKLSYPWQL